jgi:hypothetical protein
MPQKEMGQHTGEHVMVPARVFADFIVVHAEFRFGFLTPYQDTFNRHYRV